MNKNSFKFLLLYFLGIDDGQDLSEDMLRNVYERIKKDELITDDDHVTQVLSVCLTFISIF